MSTDTEGPIGASKTQSPNLSMKRTKTLRSKSPSLLSSTMGLPPKGNSLGLSRNMQKEKGLLGRTGSIDDLVEIKDLSNPAEHLLPNESTNLIKELRLRE